MKLELKHLAPYLPYNLEVKHIEGYDLIMDCNGENSDTLSILDVFEYAKPILRPLSDLTNDKYTEGLISLCINRNLYKSKFADGYNSYKSRIVNKPFGKIFKIQNHDDWVLLISIQEPDRTKAYIFDYLIKNHFDVFGLIKEGLAIDINTL